MAEVVRAEVRRLLLARLGEDLDEIKVEVSAAELDVMLDVAREIGLLVKNVASVVDSGAVRYRLTFARTIEDREVAVRSPDFSERRFVNGQPLRYVNTFVAAAGEERAVSTPLALDRDYDMVCNSAALIPGACSPWIPRPPSLRNCCPPILRPFMSFST